MKRAIIDIGTNSVLLLIGRFKGNRIESLIEKFNVTRLGENVQRTGKLSDTAMQRTMNILHEYYHDIQGSGVEDVHVLGTESLRMANNQNDFIRSLSTEFGWHVKILTGEEEAFFSYLGAVSNTISEDAPAIVVDVGGGSTEIISGVHRSVNLIRSIPVGVVKLAEMYGMKPRLAQKDMDKILILVREKLKGLSLSAETQLIGSGGTVTTLAAIREKMYPYNPEIINGYVLELSELIDLYNELNALNLTERRQLPGLVPGREDVILYGTLMFIAFMKEYNYNKIVASDRGLRYGWFYHLESSDTN